MDRNMLKRALTGMLLTGAAIFAVASEASAEDCRPVIVKEGYLSQAQFECDFADLGEALQDASRKCGDKLGKDAVGEALKEGMEAAIAEVDAQVRKAGDSATWCEDITKRYPDDVIK
jgi:hypothetical protein